MVLGFLIGSFYNIKTTNKDTFINKEISEFERVMYEIEQSEDSEKFFISINLDGGVYSQKNTECTIQYVDTSKELEFFYLPECLENEQNTANNCSKKCNEISKLDVSDLNLNTLYFKIMSSIFEDGSQERIQVDIFGLPISNEYKLQIYFKYSAYF